MEVSGSSGRFGRIEEEEEEVGREMVTDWKTPASSRATRRESTKNMKKSRRDEDEVKGKQNQKPKGKTQENTA